MKKRFVYNNFILTPEQKLFLENQVKRFGILNIIELIEAVKNDPDLSQDEKIFLESCFTEFRTRTGLKRFEAVQLINWVKAVPETRLSEKNQFIVFVKG